MSIKVIAPIFEPMKLHSHAVLTARLSEQHAVHRAVPAGWGRLFGGMYVMFAKDIHGAQRMCSAGFGDRLPQSSHQNVNFSNTVPATLL